MIRTFPPREFDGYGHTIFHMSFPWGDEIAFIVYSSGVHEVYGDYIARFSLIPYMCLVSALIMVGGLCGLSSRIRTRTLGGLLGTVGVASYFVFVFHKGLWNSEFPIFEIASSDRYGSISFLSVGFFLALAGSLMLLLPLIRTLVERLKKRLKSS
jgi:hypothetical protein